MGGAVAGIACNHGKGALGSILGSGESSFDSIFSTIAITSAELLVMIPVSGSRSAERCCVLGLSDSRVRSDAVSRIDLSASLVFLTNICRRAAPDLVNRS